MIVNHQFERDREQDASRLFQAIFNEALDAMLIADDEGNYIDANPAACELLGLPREELIGCNISNFAEPGLDIAQAWRSFLEQGRITGEFRILHPNGTVRETEFAATADILPHRHLSVLRDITRRKQAESQILLLNAELEQRVLERTEELRLTNEQLTREIQEHKRTEEALQLQTQRERLMVAIAQHIRQSLNLDEILNTTVTEVRKFLACDRVLIYRTGSDGMGCVITEALAPGCSAILGLPLPEEIFPQEFHQLYCKGRIRTVTDIERDELSACLAETLRQLGVKSKMVVPIIQRERLWGLLIAHQCETPRQWQQWEVDLLSSLATQVAIAIQQAELYSQLEAELTERKRIEEDLRESQQKYQTLFEIFPIGIAITDEAGNIIEANPASEQILGVSTAEQTKRKYDAPTWQIIRPDGTLMPRSEFATVKALTENRTIKNFEVGVVKPDEEISWLSITAAPIPLPGYGVAIAYIDISDRKKAEERLRLQAERERLIGAMQARIRQSLNLSDILKTTVNEVRAFLQTDRVIIHRLQPDGSGRIVTESLASGWMPTLGWVISDPWIVDQQYQDDYQWNHIQAINDIFTANLAEYHIHLLESFQVRALLVVPIHAGETLWGLLMAHHCHEPRQWQQWEIDLLSSLATQIGIAIQQSELYLQLEAQLTELQQTEAALQQAKEAAEVANRAKTEFLATMSHELRTPLNGILGYAQILQTSTHLTQQQRNSLNIIHQCGEYLLTLISDILDLSKIEARKFELFPVEFHLPNVLNSLADFFRLRAQQKGISFTYEILSPLPNGVRGDEKRLRQVLINLLNNAIKFTDKGGVTFKVGLMAHGSWLTADSQEQLAIYNLRFQIEDTGIGIELSRLTEIFLPFHQVSDRSHAVEGTGLGLAISQKLVQLMGSEIKVRSILGEGSVFLFDLNLPSVSGWHESSPSRDRRLISFKGNKRKVLIVDDNQVNRSLLRDILEPLGLEIIEAVDGQDCLHKALEFQPHLILMDLIMPVLDGLEATRRVRQLPRLQDVVVIALSANVLETTKQQSLAAGCQDFLPKPVQVQQLLQFLTLHLDVEGIYEEDLSSRETESKCSCISIVPPPPSELLTLSKLAKIGDIQGLLDRADQLEKWDNRFVLFVTQLRQLTKSFQLKQLRKFIQNYMTDNNSEFNL
jgi:PAS domain S-box-containing protein